MATKKNAKANGEGLREILIQAPKMQTMVLEIEGTAPLVIHRFGQKAMEAMKAKQEGGSTSQGKRKREAKDFKECYEQAKHVAREGWCGIPASGFRAAMISACRTAGVVMTRAKLAFFVEADGFDRVDGVPLVKITKGEPKHVEHYARNETGVVDIRARPMWAAGWRAKVRITFDADMFTATDVANLMMRVGLQVGICEGRPDSKKSTGMGWGTFKIVGK